MIGLRTKNVSPPFGLLDSIGALLQLALGATSSVEEASRGEIMKSFGRVISSAEVGFEAG